jgi:hypothetical protein
MAKALLDTDVPSEYLKGHDRNLIRRAADYAREQSVFTFTSITVHEIVFGLELKNAASQLRKTLAWLDQNECPTEMGTEGKVSTRSVDS